MFTNGNGNWKNIINDAFIIQQKHAYNDMKIISVDATINPRKFDTLSVQKSLKQCLDLVIMSEMMINVISCQKDANLVKIEHI